MTGSRLRALTAMLSGALLGGLVFALPGGSGPASLPALVIDAPARLPALLVRRAEEVAVERAAEGERVRATFTAYCLTGTTREGRPVRPWLIAADPRVFPLGREVDVFVGEEYHGRYYVGDTGRLIVGPVLDLWVDDCDEAIRFGRRRGWAILVPAGEEAAP